jgi:hypothetical protein
MKSAIEVGIAMFLRKRGGVEWEEADREVACSCLARGWGEETETENRTNGVFVEGIFGIIKIIIFLVIKLYN